VISYRLSVISDQKKQRTVIMLSVIGICLSRDPGPGTPDPILTSAYHIWEPHPSAPAHRDLHNRAGSRECVEDGPRWIVVDLGADMICNCLESRLPAISAKSRSPRRKDTNRHKETKRYGTQVRKVTDDVRRLLDKVLKDHFGELKNAKSWPCFDVKKRTSAVRLVLGRIMKTNDLLSISRDTCKLAEGTIHHYHRQKGLGNA